MEKPRASEGIYVTTVSTPLTLDMLISTLMLARPHT
ncbi:hypothetical protein BQ8482_380230 [Mesorhizobium delmotii]|uniref:Uncharacterized protein n=1 Tax=Mesorhizobium delmotii TaxID=1631247 RepID=A0A2P9ASH2_9HYPH|nr:hypothetical protein BQ8482_380230 [Mesorhizobium delmotii]